MRSRSSTAQSTGAFDQLQVGVHLHPVEDDFLGVDDENQPQQILEWLVRGKLLDVGIAHTVALLGGFGLVKHLELD